jgi:hypothetical protein
LNMLEMLRCPTILFPYQIFKILRLFWIFLTKWKEPGDNLGGKDWFFKNSWVRTECRFLDTTIKQTKILLLFTFFNFLFLLEKKIIKGQYFLSWSWMNFNSQSLNSVLFLFSTNVYVPCKISTMDFEEK